MKYQITIGKRAKNATGDASGQATPPRRLGRFMSVVVGFLLLCVLVGVLIAAFVVGTFIAGIILVVLVVTCIGFLVARLLRRRA